MTLFLICDHKQPIYPGVIFSPPVCLVFWRGLKLNICYTKHFLQWSRKDWTTFRVLYQRTFHCMLLRQACLIQPNRNPYLFLFFIQQCRSGKIPCTIFVYCSNWKKTLFFLISTYRKKPKIYVYSWYTEFTKHMWVQYLPLNASKAKVKICFIQISFIITPSTKYSYWLLTGLYLKWYLGEARRQTCTHTFR